MSARCARAREKGRCRGGRSILTVTGGEIGNQWRRGGFELRSLAAFWLWFWRGTSAEEGGFVGVKTWTRGKELIRNRGRFGGDLPGVRRVRPGLHERDDMWGRGVGERGGVSDSRGRAVSEEKQRLA
jgi:hypothetical protein